MGHYHIIIVHTKQNKFSCSTNFKVCGHLQPINFIVIYNIRDVRYIHNQYTLKPTIDRITPNLAVLE